jgi:hypothetical protein
LLRGQKVITTIPYDGLTYVARDYSQLVDAIRHIDRGEGFEALEYVRDMINDWSFIEQ